MMDEVVTNDGVYSYTYDAENRITRTLRNGTNNTYYYYDYLGRRHIKYYAPGAGVSYYSRVYIYDGWNPVLERDYVYRNYDVTYTWNPDSAKSGGIGGLISMTDNRRTNTYYYFNDANGNISDLIQVSGLTYQVSAHYEYVPFGNQTKATGS